MSGMHNNQICIMRNQFKMQTEKQVKARLRNNRILFHGTPGNGKTTYAKKLAQLTNRKLIDFSAASIVEAYPGKGVQKIITLVGEVENIVRATGRGVIIFVDEIEVLASNTETEFRAEHKSTLAQLWTTLDKYELNNDILFVFATNNIKKISRTFLDRFVQENVIEITKPDDTNRREMIVDFVVGMVPVLDEATFDRYVYHLLSAYAQEVENEINGIKSFLQQHYTDLTEISAKNDILISVAAIDAATQEALKSIEKIPEFQSIEQMQKAYIHNFKIVFMRLKAFSKKLTQGDQLKDLDVSHELVKKISFTLELEKTSEQILQSIYKINENLRQVDKAIDVSDTQVKQLCVQEINDIASLIDKIEQNMVQLIALRDALQGKQTCGVINNYIDSLENFITDVKGFLTAKNKFSTQVIPSDLLSSLVDVTNGLSNRRLENFKEQITKIIGTTSQQDREDLLKELKVSVSNALALSKKVSTSEDHDAIRLLAAKFELIRAYQHLECGDCPLPECLDMIKAESLYEQLKEEYKTIFKQ
jgi:hypothetical protein